MATSVSPTRILRSSAISGLADTSQQQREADSLLPITVLIAPFDGP